MNGLFFTLFASLVVVLQVSASPLHFHLHQRGASVEGNATSTESEATCATFGYTGINGPLGWAGLSPDNALCSTGTSQSPINFNAQIKKASANPTVWMPDGFGDFENLGTTVEVSQVGKTTFEGKVYNLQQFHFHTPSEHRIEDETFPLEVHFVHAADDGAGLVLGAVFDITPTGATTEFVHTLGQEVEKIPKAGDKTQVHGLKLGKIVEAFQTGPLFTYSGSLTTPPCSEGITWVFAQNPLPIDVKSYLAFKNVIKFNARFTQNNSGEKNLIDIAATQIGPQFKATQVSEAI
ncbi:hypothetical protein H0H81_005414 [Sphagnurus paluster]|uniref:Carbonic anhydrase n=1 Tax=Sphagnurus paluster TaxID=117069 RepID=A0A9P7K6X4_9AGAR|nr:hypothetical protein H0H81_005414 [Sphagnurus paluster]